MNTKKDTYYSRNREKCLSKSKEYYKNNKEKALTYLKDYREKNKEKIREKQKRSRAIQKANFDTLKEENTRLLEENSNLKKTIKEFLNKQDYSKKSRDV
jgi:hypothetical protein